MPRRAACRSVRSATGIVLQAARYAGDLDGRSVQLSSLLCVVETECALLRQRASKFSSHSALRALLSSHVGKATRRLYARAQRDQRGRCVVQQVQTAGQFGGVAQRNEIAIEAVPHDFACRPGAGGNHGNPQGHRFQIDDAESLEGGHNQEIGGGNSGFSTRHLPACRGTARVPRNLQIGGKCAHGGRVAGIDSFAADDVQRQGARRVLQGRAGQCQAA